MKSKLMISTFAITLVVALSVFQNCSPIKFGADASSSSASSASPSEIGAEQNAPVPDGSGNGPGGSGTEQAGNTDEDQRKIAALLVIL